MANKIKSLTLDAARAATMAFDALLAKKELTEADRAGYMNGFMHGASLGADWQRHNG